MAQTLIDNVVDGRNTIAAEFRTDGDLSNELKVTAQNFRVKLVTEDNNSRGSQSVGRVSHSRYTYTDDESESSQTESASPVAAAQPSSGISTAAAGTQAANAQAAETSKNPKAGKEVNYALAALTLISSALAFVFGKREESKDE